MKTIFYTLLFLFSIALNAQVDVEVDSVEVKPKLRNVIDSSVIGKFEPPFLVKGTLTEQKTGEPIPFANVELLDSALNQIYVTSTDFDGNYTLVAIKGGVYQLRFSFVGFKSCTIDDIRITESAVPKINVQMAVGKQPKSVVTICRPLIDISNTTNETKFSKEEIRRSPY